MLFALAVAAKVLWIDGWPGWALIGLGAVLEAGETYVWIRWSRRRHVQVGVETLVGAEAVVVSGCYPVGQVRVRGELWQAHCPEHADPGEHVVVEGLDGLSLRVRHR